MGTWKFRLALTESYLRLSHAAHDWRLCRPGCWIHLKGKLKRQTVSRDTSKEWGGFEQPNIHSFWRECIATGGVRSAAMSKKLNAWLSAQCQNLHWNQFTDSEPFCSLSVNTCRDHIVAEANENVVVEFSLTPCSFLVHGQKGCFWKQECRQRSGVGYQEWGKILSRMGNLVCMYGSYLVTLIVL